ncbi:hypothetical protein IFM89_035508 [Coptis chinensis]|uniref:Uncharacterized protein n=1 Tax=Coptis chinensis TaxID=261450 RepID=A0A835LGQ8_9MAGN|nr:hypothetical protein IFM89_035508 [Coptis chinensis]
MSIGEFSFPTIIDNPSPRFELSPSSLWRIPSEVSLASCLVDDANGGQDYIDHNTCLSSIGCGAKKTNTEEEKMDMLWENFNDELHRNSSFRSKKQVESSLEHDEVSKSITTLHSTKKPNLLLILKVLRKFFLVQNS